MTFFQILAGKHGLAITQQNAKKTKAAEDRSKIDWPLYG